MTCEVVPHQDSYYVVVGLAAAYSGVLPYSLLPVLLHAAAGLLTADTHIGMTKASVLLIQLRMEEGKPMPCSSTAVYAVSDVRRTLCTAV